MNQLRKICIVLMLIASLIAAVPTAAFADEPCSFICGDPNDDGAINIADYTICRLHILGLNTLLGDSLNAGDIDGDGNVSIADYTMIRLHILGLRDIASPIISLPLTNCVIGIDPGHQAQGNSEKELVSPTGSATKAKVSSGTYGRFTGVPEYVLNLDVALLLRDKLRALGATVVMSRETHDVNISNAERAVLMNNVPVDCWIRIHADGSDNPSTYGISYLAPSAGSMNTTDPAVQTKSVRLANALLSATIAATNAKSNGVKLRSDQTGFCWSSTPVCTVEMGFMTNEAEDRAMATPEYKEILSQGIANGFIAYFQP